MRAVKGAISGCTYSASQDRFILETIGDNAAPLGLCGSGIIEAVHALREAGMVIESGQLILKENNRATDPADTDNQTDRRANSQTVSKVNNSTNRVSLVNGSAGAGAAAGVDVYITQQDIRQIQLAKAALATGIVYLMEKAGISRVDRTILTGAFGKAFNLQKAMEIGMLPDLSLLGQIEIKANLAGQGAVMLLLDDVQRRSADTIQANTTYIHLADDPIFTQRFVSQTMFPYIHQKQSEIHVYLPYT